MPTSLSAVARVGRKLFTLTATERLGTITHVATREPVAALTFDDGPDPHETPAVLEILERHGARATFFMIGRAALEYRTLVKHIAEAGHGIGNHTFDHAALSKTDGTARRETIRAGAEALAPWGCPLLRPPYGQVTPPASIDAHRLHHEVVAWNVDVGDWWNPDADAMAADLSRRVRPGSVVLLHDVLRRHADAAREPEFRAVPHPDRRAMRTALDRFLTAARDRLRFVTLAELLDAGTAVRRGW